MNLIEYSRMYEAEERHWWYVGLHKLIMAAVQRESARLGRPLTIFDAGCGTGRLCQLLTAQGHTVSGCDFSEEALRLCRLRGVTDTFPADLNSIELDEESYDVITSIDVLYHRGVSDDAAVMRRLQRALKPGGLLILNLVAHEFLRSSHDIAVHTRERYTRGILCQRLQSAGFTIASSTYRVSLLFPLIVAYRLLSQSAVHSGADPVAVASDVAMPPPMINSLLLKVIDVENMILTLTSLPFGSSVFVAARKQYVPYEE
ncbi:MAG TPA: class I SAM-dependent methyltransferase [Desulfuromonadales bacterium]|nr:class I SAM-dependent methyltransferase [Desulfuromonadales bacterium]